MKVLALNGGDRFGLPNSYEVVTESQIGNHDGYKTTAESLERITELTKNKKVDVVVIQNNMGAGVGKAKAVDPYMRGKTIISWNTTPASSDKTPYLSLGIKYFTRFDGVAGLVAKI